MRQLFCLAVLLCLVNCDNQSNLPPMEVDAFRPFDGETAVAAGFHPKVILDAYQSGRTLPSPDALSLHRKADGAPIAGHAERVALLGVGWQYTFVPDAALPADDYQLQLPLDGGPDDYTIQGLTRVEGTAILGFSTISSPAVLEVHFFDDQAVIVSFTQAMDEGSLGVIDLLDAAGSRIPVKQRTYLDVGNSFEVLLLPADGQVGAAVQIAGGLRAADGTPVAGLPVTLSR